MNLIKVNANPQGLLLGLLLMTPVALATENALTTPYLKTDSPSAVVSLLEEAKKHFEAGENEQAAAILERALRIEPQNAVLWHNLAGVRLKQGEWKRAANLADKSNTLVGNNKMLRVRNWMIIAWACEGMGDAQCAVEARQRAEKLLASSPASNG